MLLLSGCSVGPTYHPDLRHPGGWHWRNDVAGNGAMADNRNGGALIRVAAAGRSDAAGADGQRRYRGGDGRVREADAQVRIAGAPLLPTVDLQARGSRQRTFGVGCASADIYRVHPAADGKL